jgi:hypothetical protein
MFADLQRHLNQTIGVVNTLVLLTSSLLVVSAVRALRAGGERLGDRIGPRVSGGLFRRGGHCDRLHQGASGRCRRRLKTDPVSI